MIQVKKVSLQQEKLMNRKSNSGLENQLYKLKPSITKKIM